MRAEVFERIPDPTTMSFAGAQDQHVQRSRSETTWAPEDPSGAPAIREWKDLEAGVEYAIGQGSAGVAAHNRGHGIGTALVTELVDRLSAAGVRKLLVKTLSDREDPGPEYSATRAFYLVRGFVPAAELEGDPENPIQLMPRRI